MKKCRTYIENRRIYRATYLLEAIALATGAAMIAIPLHDLWVGGDWSLYFWASVLLVWGSYWDYLIFTQALPGTYEAREKFKWFLHMYKTDEDFRQIILDEDNE
jgi:hypothetical protein